MKAAASIHRRMLRVVMTTTLVALLMSATSLLVYELQAHRASWAQDLRTQAALVAQASVSALSFDDARVAQDNLALLRLRPQIESAALYDAHGRLFAGYAARGRAAPPDRLAASGPGTVDAGNRFELRQPIVQDGEPLGMMVLSAHYDVLPRLLDYLSILATVTLASLALAGLVARRLQRAVTDPIVAVADVAREVVQSRNFSLRAPRTTDDEVGALVDAFNDMLRELGEQAGELQAIDRRKDEFLATLAHELRNPLAPVATALTILRGGDADAATQARLVAMMQRQMAQFVRLIDDLMEVSRISTGRLALRMEPLDLVQVLRGAVESVAPALLERRHTLAVEWPAAQWVLGDRTRLGQVFVNLLANATKYTDPGGRVTIDFKPLPDAVEVRVSDNGIGIAPEMQREVFEMFVQVDRSLAGGRSGLGVGLSLARQLVQLHQGSLTLESPGLGQGAAFTVQLPRYSGPPAPASVPTAVADRSDSTGRVGRTGDEGQADGLGDDTAPSVAGAVRRAAAPGDTAASLRVLVADDNQDFANSLAAVLQAAGHEVQVVFDGAAALSAATAQLPQVGLFDIGMPRLDGYALAAAVRQLPGGADCLLVAITGWGQLADQLRARSAGYDEHLVKPVDMDALLRLLAQKG